MAAQSGAWLGHRHLTPSVTQRDTPRTAGPGTSLGHTAQLTAEPGYQLTAGQGQVLRGAPCASPKCHSPSFRKEGRRDGARWALSDTLLTGVESVRLTTLEELYNFVVRRGTKCYFN